jgi:hypothetical protein
VPIETTGIESDATLKDYANLSVLLAASNNEQTTIGRKTATGVVATVDNTNDWVDIDADDPVWTATSGNAISALLLCWDGDTTAGTDANIVPSGQVRLRHRDGRRPLGDAAHRRLHARGLRPPDDPAGDRRVHRRDPAAKAAMGRGRRLGVGPDRPIRRHQQCAVACPNNFKTYTLPSAAATVIYGIAFNYNTAVQGNTGTTSFQLGAMLVGGVVQCIVGVNTSGFIEVRRGTLWSSGTILATSSGHTPIGTGAFHQAEVKGLMHTSTGQVIVKLDGVQVIDTGVGPDRRDGRVGQRAPVRAGGRYRQRPVVRRLLRL